MHSCLAQTLFMKGLSKATWKDCTWVRHELLVRTDSPKKVWSYQGTVRYATNDILSALAGMAESGQVRMQREAKHDLVAFVKSFWAIQGERADLLNQIHASNIEGIRVFWAGQVADIGMGRKL
ncbi:TPA: hypothetical protein ACH3X1_013929 [Trebouxia sp. C0004]